MSYTAKTWGFDQSERAQGSIYVLNFDKTWVFDQSERAQVPIYIINSNIACQHFQLRLDLLIRHITLCTPWIFHRHSGSCQIRVAKSN